MSVDRRKIDKLFDVPPRKKLPGYAVGIMQDGEIVHANEYGVADLEHGAPITSDTVFHVASLSKQFTAAAVLMLEEAGKLALDDLVTRHVDGLPDCARQITLRHLLHHTSGLRDQWPLLRLAGWRDMDEKTEEDVLDLVRRQKRLNFPPGENFAYCNTGYTLLAGVVRRRSTDSLRKYTDENIFKPLRMTTTHFRDDHTKVLPGRAFGYTDAGAGEFGFWVPNFDLVGPTSLHTTVKDLLQWARTLLAPSGVFVPVVKGLLTPGTLNDGRRLGYGAGVGLGRHRGLEIVRHSGWDLGYVSHLAVYPTERFAVAILGNLFPLAPALKAREVAEICLDGRFREDPATPVRLPAHELTEKEGVYRHRVNHRVQWVTRSGDGLFLSFERPSRSSRGSQLDPLAPGRFLGADKMTEAAFDGTTMTIRGEFGTDEQFDRVAPSDPSATALAAYSGTYRSLELGTTLTVLLDRDNGFVVTQHRGPRRPLVPAYEDAFTDDNKATYIFSRDGAGEVDGLTFAQERVHHLRFDRVS